MNIELGLLTKKLIDYAQKQGSSYGFSYLREKIYGKNEMSYNGKGCCGMYSELLNSEIKGKILCHNMDVYECMTPPGYAVSDHCYIYRDNIIIDPTYRQLFLNTTGNIDKEFSPYTEFIYRDLPVIFIGTREEFILLVEKIKKEKEKDSLHLNYNIHPIVDEMCELE